MSAGRKQEQIVILGAGYAGLMATVRLVGRTGGERARIRLINTDDTFVERIRLHQVAAGQAIVRRPITDYVRGTGIDFLQGRVVGLDPARHEVTVDAVGGERRISYDRLVIALGSSAATDTVPGIQENAWTLESGMALQLRDSLADVARRNGRVAVCGAGLTGIEAATEIAEAYPTLRVTMVTAGAFGTDLSERGRAHVRRALARLGVEIIEWAPVRAVERDRLVLENQGVMPFDLCVWAGGFVAAQLAHEAGLAVNDLGQALVDAYLRSVSHPMINVVGDAAAPGVPIRMACATAMPMGAYVADYLANELAGRPSSPFRFAYAFRCISLGRADALIQFVRSDDAPTERIMTGWVGARFKELICQYATFALRLERRWPGAYRWPRENAPRQVRMQEIDPRYALRGHRVSTGAESSGAQTS